MTSPDLPPGRPVPDTDDLRLLAQIIDHGVIGLPQAAWGARMSQAEAATRLVQMAERNLPLRLVAEGDRQALWRVAQAGPATGGLRLDPGGPGQNRASATSFGHTGGLGPGPGPERTSAIPPASGQPALPLSGAVPGRPGGPAPLGPPVGAIPVVLPPTSAVPPHEQAVAGAVPFGQPPFGQSPYGQSPSDPPASPPSEPYPDDAATDSPDTRPTPVASGPVHPAPPAGPTVAATGPAAVWGPPGSAAWARGDHLDPAVPASPTVAPAAADAPAVGFGGHHDDESHDGASHEEANQDAPAGCETGRGSADSDHQDPADSPDIDSTTSDPGDGDNVATDPDPDPQLLPVQWQTTVGLSDEQLWVTLLQFLDPADTILTTAGYRLDDGERAILVRTAMANHGPAPHDSLPDQYLVLKTADGAVLPKTPMGVASHPSFRVGVPAGGQADGWTVFLIPTDTVVAEVGWSVRPDLLDRTLRWTV